MSLASKIIWSSIVILFITLIVTTWIGLMNIFVVVGFFLLVGCYTGGYFYLITSYSKSEIELNKPSNKSSLDHCWKEMNISLTRQPGGVPLTWSEGVSRFSIIKYLTNNSNKEIPFRAMYGHDVEGNQVLVIYDIENEHIAVYNSEPSSDQLSDPFKDFDPFNNAQKFNGYNGYNNGFSNNKRNKKGGFNLQLQGFGNDEEDLGPTPSMIDGALEHGGYNGRE